MRWRRVSFAVAVATADPANQRRAVLLRGRLLELQWGGRLVLLLREQLRGKLRWGLLQPKVQSCSQSIVEDSDETCVTRSRVQARLDTSQATHVHLSFDASGS